MMTNGIDEDDCEDCCDRCFCFPCSLIGYACCCRRMSRTRKIQFFWGWLIATAISIALVVGLVVNRPITMAVAPTDMLDFSNTMSFVFCDELEVNSPDLMYDGYIVPTPVTIDTEHTETYQSSATLFTEAGGFTFYSFYLLPGSTVNLMHCSETPLTFYIFKGDDSFDHATDTGIFSNCYDSGNIPYSLSCTHNRDYHEFHFTVEEEDRYYFLYSNVYEEVAWLNFQVDLNRTVYDLSKAKLVCSSTLGFSLPLNGPDEAVVIAVEGFYSLTDKHDSSLTITCVPRIWAYMLILGVGILVIGMTTSVLIQKFCTDHQLVYQGRNRARAFDRTPLLYDVAPPSYESVSVYPPKYEDICRHHDTESAVGLPSYVEAVHSLTSNTSGQEQGGPQAETIGTETQISDPDRMYRDGCSSAIVGNCTGSTDLHSGTQVIESPVPFSGEHLRATVHATCPNRSTHTYSQTELPRENPRCTHSSTKPPSSAAMSTDRGFSDAIACQITYSDRVCTGTCDRSSNYTSRDNSNTQIGTNSTCRQTTSCNPSIQPRTINVLQVAAANVPSMAATENIRNQYLPRSASAPVTDR